MANKWPDGGEQPSGPLGLAFFYGMAWIMWGGMASVLVLAILRWLAGPPSMIAVAAAFVIGFGAAGWSLVRVARGKA